MIVACEGIQHQSRTNVSSIVLLSEQARDEISACIQPVQHA